MSTPSTNQSASQTNRHDEKGFALILSLVTLALISSMGLAAIYQSNTEVSVVGNEQVGNTLLMAADAGSQYGQNQIWVASGFANNTGVSFATLDSFFANNPLPLTLPSPATPLPGGLSYKVVVPATVSVPGSGTTSPGYDQSNGTQRVITLRSTAWSDDNGNGVHDPTEQSRVVTSRVAFTYGSLTFPYGVVTQKTECVFCHLRVIGDVVSLDSLTVRKFNEAYSTIQGKVYTMGVTNLDNPNSRVVESVTPAAGGGWTETALNVQTGYTDPDRFPVDSNGNPSFPKIENMDYYAGLAGAYNGGAGSSLSGGVISGIPAGTTYSNALLGNMGNINQTFSGNVIINGTPGNCIQLDGPVVVRGGDLIISGCVTGQGSLYVEGNIYVADSVTYTDPSADKLGFAAGGNIIIGDFRNTSAFGKGDPNNLGGGKYIDKQSKLFNDVYSDPGNTVPAGERRYYAGADGVVIDSNGTVTPAAGDQVIYYTPRTNGAGGAPWISDADYFAFTDTVNGVTQMDALAYTANGIFGINLAGNKQMTINGALVSADIGLLIPGVAGKTKDYDPALIGLTIVYDRRIQDFLSVARNPTKSVISWREGE